MNVTTAMRGYGRTARYKAEAMGHHLRDAAMEKRLDRASHEAERLRFENELLRDEVEETRSEHHRILDLIEERLPQNGEKRSHKGRWLLFLAAIGGAGYAAYRRFRTPPDLVDDLSQTGTSDLRRDVALA